MKHRRPIQIVTSGRNRIVILVGRYAIKLPTPRNWRDFLFGLLNNMNEAAWHHQHPSYCPVLWAAPLGFAVIMPRAQEVTEFDWDYIVLTGWQPDPPAGAELKPSSWGWLAGNLVAVDYGWR